MDQQSMSISAGDLAGDKHNLDLDYRSGLKNVDKNRSQYNVCLCDTPLPDFYAREFGAAVGAYNAKQVEKGHPERQIKDYLDKIEKGKQEKPAYEVVVQIGNQWTMPATDEDCRAVSQLILKQFYDEWPKRYPNMKIVSAVIHMDEATPHMHVVYVPVSQGNKRGLETKNSLRGALKACGFGTDLRDWNQDMFECLESVSQEHGIERLDMGMSGCARLSVRDFKAHVNDPDYPYQNDPDLLALLDEQAFQLEEASQTLDDIVEEMNGIAQTPTGVTHVGEMRDAIKRAGTVAHKADGLAKSLREAQEAMREWFEAVPEFWKEHVIQPISAALGGILSRLRVTDTREGLDELMEIAEDASHATLADAVTYARSAAMRANSTAEPQVDRYTEER